MLNLVMDFMRNGECGRILHSARRSGFTLVEMLIVIALIGILAAALVEKMDVALMQTRDTRRKSDLHKLQTALTTYYARFGQYPSTGGVGNGFWYASNPGWV